ncbi:MAG: VPLPA-CTERM sorting domain-containing protein [Pseudomonadota bacterium]
MKFVSSIILGAAVAATALPAAASHNRGSVLIPTIDGNGNLTVETTSFWRTTFPDRVSRITIEAPDGTSVTRTTLNQSTDTADTRWYRTDDDYTGSLSGLFGASATAGVYTISWDSCCRVGGLPSGANEDMGTTSTILWDGQNAVDPITFDIQNIQPNVVRGAPYSDNLDVTSADGNALSYNDAYTPVGITTQATGFAIDGSGQISIAGADTATYADNPSAQNIGADIAFYGAIVASDGGTEVANVQFDWVFDGVDQGSNQVPDVADVVINAMVGDAINTLITATDPNGDPIALSQLSFNGPGGSIAGSMFLDNGDDTGTFTWDSTGFAVGTYIATILGNDGGLTDQGTVTINLTAGGGTGPTPVPLPAGMVLMLSGLAGLGFARKFRK